MTLPEYILNIFNKFNSGILSPLIQGLYMVMPYIAVIGFGASIIWLIFADRKGPAIGSLVLSIVLIAVFVDVPNLINLIINWFSGSGTVDVSSATASAQNGLNQGISNISSLQ